MSFGSILATLQTGKLHIFDSDLSAERLRPIPLCLKCYHYFFIPTLRILALFLRISKSDNPEYRNTETYSVWSSLPKNFALVCHVPSHCNVCDLFFYAIINWCPEESRALYISSLRLVASLNSLAITLSVLFEVGWDCSLGVVIHSFAHWLLSPWHLKD